MEDEGERLESCIKRREAVFQRERIPQSIDRTTISYFINEVYVLMMGKFGHLHIYEITCKKQGEKIC